MTLQAKEKLLAILFADISGSTALYETLGDQQAKLQIAECLGKLAKIAEHWRGALIKTIGDEIMCHFPDAARAVQAAVAMQKSLALKVPGTAALQVRIGLHYGPVIQEQGDVFGDAVNVAARVTAISKGGQIITTQDTVAGLPTLLKSQCRLFDKAQLKGKKDLLDIYQVLWAPHEATQLASQIHSEPKSTATYLHLRYRDAEMEMNMASPPLDIGRDINCGLVVIGKFASRHHARIQYRRGKFVLLDQSTNGTLVEFQNGESVYLRREELPLWGAGIISLNGPVAQDHLGLIHFSCR